MHDVFISYSSKDIDITEQVRQILETNGISCWIAPRNIPGGSNYAREIPAAIRGCKVFLLIMSQQAQDSIWVYRELDRAINERKVVIPLLVEDVAFNDQFDFYLTGYHRYAAYEKTSEILELLVKRIQAVIDADTAPRTKSAAAQQNSFPKQLRYDGFYRYLHPNTQGFYTYYRFFPNGTVVSANTAARPSDVKKWLDASQSHGSSIATENDTLYLTEVLGTGDTHRSKLSFEDDCMLMEGYDYRALKNTVKTCAFLPFSEISDAEPRYDGFYITPKTGACRSFYRFYPDGVVVSSYTTATPAQAKQWLDCSKDEGARVTTENGHLWMTEPLSDGHSYHAKLTIDGNSLVMSGHNSFSNQTVTKTCSFLPFSEISDPAPRYDGFYISQEPGEFRNIYRFYPDGVAASAYTCATPAQAKQWLDRSHSNGCRYTTENGELWMTEPLSDGHTYHAKLTLQDDTLTISGFNSYCRETVTYTCFFVSFDHCE